MTYTQIALQLPSSQYQTQDLQSTIREFKQLLQELVSFSEKARLTPFTGCSRAAAKALSDANPLATVPHSYADAGIAPPGYLSREAQALLAAAQDAWVLGGMGSWNDVWVESEDGETYAALTKRLSSLLNTTIAQAANSSYQE